MDRQKASLLKRFSASLLDFIVIIILATFFIYLISFITGYDNYNKKLNDSYSKYENEYGIVFAISADEYYSYTEEQRNTYDRAYEALIEDEDAMSAYRMVMNLTILSLSIGIFFAYLISDFIIPLFFKNGVTIGKKVFGLCLMRKGGWKVNNLSLFIRAILGKYTIETMVSVLIIVLILFSSIGIVGPIVICALLLLNLILLFTTKDNSMIHDLLSDTIVVDYNSQFIFESEEEVLEEKKRKAKEEAEKTAY